MEKVPVFNMNSLLREKHPTYSMRFLNGVWVLIDEFDYTFCCLMTFETLRDAKTYIAKEVL